MGWKDTIQTAQTVSSSWRDTVESPEEPSIGRQIANGAADALPMAGMVAGGAGGAALTAGNLVGASLGAGTGYALGNSAKQLMNKYLLDRPVEPTNALEDMATGATGELVGAGLGKITSKLVNPETWKGMGQTIMRSKVGPAAEDLLKIGEGSVQKGKDAVNRAMQFILDRGVVTPGATAQTMAPKASRLPFTGDLPGQLLEKKAAQEAAAPMLSPWESHSLAATGGISATTGNPLPVLANLGIVAGARVVNKFVPTTAAYGANKISHGLEMVVKNYDKLPQKYQSILNASMKRGGQKAVAVTHFLLGQTDTEYQASQNQSTEPTQE